MSIEWGRWIEHDGKKFPYGERLPVVAEVHTAIIGETKIIEGHSGDCLGAWLILFGGRPLIIRYRIRKPKGLQLLQDILREVERDGDKVYSGGEMEEV